MPLLKLVSDDPDVDSIEYRDNLFYNKHEYRLRVNVPGSRYLYWTKDVDHLLLRVDANKGYPKIRNEDKQAIKNNIHALTLLIDLRKDKELKKTITIRIESNTVSIFSNDVNFLKDFSNKLGKNYIINLTKAQTTPMIGVKFFKNEPKHKFRVYLKSKRVKTEFCTELQAFFKTQNKLYPSQALKYWMYDVSGRYASWWAKYTSSHYYIDYDDESTISYLAIMYGEFLGKKFKLEKRPDNT